MGSRGCSVHLSLGDLTMVSTEIHGTLDLGDRFDDQTIEIFNEYALIGILFQLKLCWLVPPVIHQQVVDFFIVYLEVRAPDEELGANILVAVDVAEYVFEAAWDDAGAVLCAEHCVGLAAAGLPIGEDRAVIALDD